MRHRQPGKQGALRTPPSAVQWTAPSAKDDVDASRRQARRAHLRPDVEWVGAPKGTSLRRQHFPAGYKKPPNVDPAIAAQFIVGRPVMAAQALTMSQDRGTYDFAPLEPFSGEEGEAHIPTGSLLIYTGEVRQLERMWIGGKNCDVYAVKHTFITAFGRCIIHDFDLIKLITEEDLE